jgi:hypothetical protein
VTPADLLDHARKAPEHSPERSLWLVAAIEQIIGKPLVLVGGAAANTYTGEYIPTDIDLIGSGIDAADRAKLIPNGFTDPGVGHRHVHITLRPGEVPVYVEFPTPPLDAEEVTEVELAEGVVATIISLTDLVVDRLKQATDGTGVTHDAAVALIAATYEELDWEAIDRRIANQDDDLLELAEWAKTIRRAVIRALRQAPSKD